MYLRTDWVYDMGQFSGKNEDETHDDLMSVRKHELCFFGVVISPKSRCHAGLHARKLNYTCHVSDGNKDNKALLEIKTIRGLGSLMVGGSWCGRLVG